MKSRAFSTQPPRTVSLIPSCDLRPSSSHFHRPTDFAPRFYWPSNRPTVHLLFCRLSFRLASEAHEPAFCIAAVIAIRWRTRWPRSDHVTGLNWSDSSTFDRENLILRSCDRPMLSIGLEYRSKVENSPEKEGKTLRNIQSHKTEKFSQRSRMFTSVFDQSGDTQNRERERERPTIISQSALFSERERGW